MSTIATYLKMNSTDLENEIARQAKKITAAKETIALLKRLQIASAGNNQQRTPERAPTGGMDNGQH